MDLNQMQIRLNQGKNDLVFIVPVSLIKEPLRIDLGMISGTYQINH